MKLVLKNPEDVGNQRVNICKKEIPCLDSSWHYHAQYELLYISQSNGIRFVGDSVCQFFPGDLVLVGPYLPHLWRNDVSFYKENNSENQVKTIIMKFTENFMGNDTFKNPEFSEIDKLLDQSKFGVCFGQQISEELHDELVQIADLSPAMQSIKLLEILHRLSVTKEKMVLSSSDMRQYNTDNAHRLDTVLKYISDNYASYITLEDIADVACMTTNSFCRFFKKMTNKSFTQFLNEVRIRNASRLLLEDNIFVSEVCYTVGYKSITNFNNQFKQIMGCTPKQFRGSV